MVGRIFNSSLFLFCSYIIAHVVYQVVKYAGTLIIGVEDVRLCFTAVDYNPLDYANWDKYKIALVYGFPAFFCLVVAAIAAVIYYSRSSKDYFARFGLFWMAIVFLSFFISDIIAAPFYKSGIYSVYAYFYISKEVAYLVALFTLPIFPLLSLKLPKRVIGMTANSTSILRTRGSRVEYLLRITILPLAIVAVVLFLMFTIPPNYDYSYFLQREGVRLFSIALFLIFITFFGFSKVYISLDKYNQIHRTHKEYSALVLILIAAIYALLMTCL